MQDARVMHTFGFTHNENEKCVLLKIQKNI